MRQEKPKIFAVTGKGGVGKTSVAATLVRLLAEEYPEKRILAIDADPAVGLSTALGVSVKATVDDLRREVVLAADQGEAQSAVELLGEARSRIFDALVEQEGFSFLAIGRPEAAGCYCKINSYLRDVISILAENFDYVVIDGEAGIEQINRRVMERVTHLILVTDSSKKGIQVIHTIRQVAEELVLYEELGVIVNRLPGPEVKELLDTGDLPVLSYILSDPELAAFDLRGDSLFDLPRDAVLVQGVREALEKLMTRQLVSEKRRK